MTLNTGLTGAADFGDDFIFGANSTLSAVSNYKKKLIIIRIG
jgi:ribosomal protein L30E